MLPQDDKEQKEIKSSTCFGGGPDDLTPVEYPTMLDEANHVMSLGYLGIICVV